VPIVKFLLGVSDVAVPLSTLFFSVILFVVIPLAGRILTRIFITKKCGTDYFENTFVHKFDGITTIGLLLTLIMIFSFQGEIILKNPFYIVLIAIPLIIQTCLIFAIVAVAVALFGTKSPAALATTVGVLTEVLVMLFFVKIANKSKSWFAENKS
jgi:ACR3 family arsenite transporter